MSTAATEGLFDRDGEVALLREALADARDSRGRLVTVEGEPGIGKTALLATVLREATAAGCTVLAATGGELEREFAWGGAFASSSSRSCTARVQPAGDRSCAVLPPWRGRHSADDAAAGRGEGPLPRSTASTG